MLGYYRGRFGFPKKKSFKELFLPLKETDQRDLSARTLKFFKPERLDFPKDTGR
jgi:hypothetical protein